jgi:thymidylate synthase
VAHLIRGKSIAEVWSLLINDILVSGRIVSPRGKQTREIMNASLEIEDGLNNIIINKARDINYRFMIAEWLWIQIGLNDVESIAQYNSNMRQFSDDGEILNGAYGPRLKPQWPYITDILQNPDTRQAVTIIWTASPTQSKDIPCTISLQWLVREERLHCTINMRSSDAWLGLPYDFFTFSQLTNALASELGFEVGSITMNLASSHLYETHWHSAVSAVCCETEGLKSPQLPNTKPFPKDDDIKQILKHQYLILDDIWYYYNESLKKGKRECLEVLRGISPK